MTPSASNAGQVLEDARRLGLEVTIDGADIKIRPKHLCKQPLRERFRRHKSEIINLLERGSNLTKDVTLGGLSRESPGGDQPARVFFLPPDEQAWLPIAEQVIAGEFTDANSSTLASLLIGLRGINHPTCRGAVQLLENLQTPMPRLKK